MRNFLDQNVRLCQPKSSQMKLKIVGIPTFPPLACPLRNRTANVIRNYSYEPHKSLVKETIVDREDKIWLSICEIGRVKDGRRFTSLRSRISARRLVKLLNLTPGLANPRLQNQLYYNTLHYHRFSRKHMRFKPLTPEDYFAKKVAPEQMLKTLVNRNLVKPRYIRIGKSWIRDTDGTKIKISPNSLRKPDFVKWLIAETYKGLSESLCADIDYDLECREPLDRALPLDNLQIDWKDYLPKSLWDRRDPETILARLEEAQDLDRQSETNQAQILLSRMMLEATAQGSQYIAGVRKLIERGIDPVDLDDKELSSLLFINPSRIRQLRLAFRKQYRTSCE